VTRALREEALRAENERFRVGSSTTLLVAQAQRDLLESQIAEVEALTAYRLALIDLYVAEGTLTQRRGLNLPG
jgi:outer membrane protein TolC